MPSVDNRIVQMRFNNAQFERAAAASMNTIRKLKESLKFKGAEKGLQSVANSANEVSFSGMSKALDAISHRFSTFGVIGAAALQKLTYTAIDTGIRIKNAITGPLVEGGKRRSLNIEQAKFQFKGLGIDVEKAMASALEAVSGTAYGLDEAAKVASMFGASGMKAGAEMTQSLRAVSGVAAMTGSGYEEIGNIFTQVAGQGRLMGDQLMQLSGRGINAAATLAQALGKTEGEVREMVSDGEISFEVFYKAMDEAFGEHSKAANKTFTGSLANMKAALSRIGADVATPAFRSFRNVFNTLTPVIDNFHNALNPLIGSMTKTIKHAEKFAKAVLNSIKTKDLNNIGKGLNNLYKTAGNVFKGITSVLKPLKAGLKEALPPATTKAFVQFTKTLKNVTSSLKATGGAAQAFKNIGLSIGNLVSSVINVAKAIGGVFKPIREAVTETIEPFKKTIKDLLPESITGSLVKFTEGIKNFTANLKLTDAQSEKIKAVFKGLFTVIGSMLRPVGNLGKILKTVLNPAFKLFGNVLKAAGSSIKVTFNAIVDMLALGINPLSKAIAFIVPKVTDFAKTFINAVKNTKVFQSIVEKVRSVLDKLTGSFSKNTSKMTSFTTVIKSLASSALDGIRKVLSKIVNLFPSIGEKISEFISNFKQLVSDIAWGLGEAGKDLGTNLGDAIDVMVYDIKNGVSNLKDILASGINSFKGFISDLPSSLSEVGPWFSNLIATVKESISEFMGNVAYGFGNLVKILNTKFDGFGEWLVSTMLNALILTGKAVITGFTTIIKSLTKFGSEMIEVFKTVAPKIGLALKTGFLLAGKATNSAIESLLLAIKMFVIDAGIATANLAPILVDGIIFGIKQLASQISILLKGAIDILETFVSECERVAKSIGLSIGKAVLKGFGTVSKDTVDNLNSITNVLTIFSSSIKKSMSKALENVSQGLNSFKDSLKEVLGSLKLSALEKLGDILDELKKKFGFLSGPVNKAKNIVNSFFDSIKERANNAIEVWKGFFNTIKNVFGKIKTFLKPATDAFSKFFEGVTFADVFNTFSLVTVAKAFKQLSGAFGGVGKSFKGLLSSASKTLDSVRESLELYQKTVKAKVLKDIAIAVGILAASIIALSFIKPEEAVVGLLSVSALLGEVIATLKILDGMDVDTKQINKLSLSMDLIALSISILAGALKKLQGFESIGSMAPALIAVSALIAEMAAATVLMAKELDKAGGDKIGTDMIKASIAMVAMSAAISKLATAAQKLGTMPLNELLQGAGAVGVLLTALVAFSAVTKGRELDNVAKVIMAISISMLLLQKAIQKLGSMNFKIMANGLMRLAGLMGTLVIAMNLMRNVNMKGTASTILAMSVALNALIIPIKVFGSMNLATLAQGLIAVGVALAEMALAVNMMPSGGTKGAGAMIAMAAALTILAVPIKLLGSMDLMSLVIGLTAVGVALGGLTAVMVILAPLGASLITVAGAFALFGGAIALVGAGILAFSVGLTTLAASAGLCTGAIMIFLGALPMIATELNAVLAVIAGLAPSMAASIQIIANSIITTLGNIASSILTTLLDVIVQFVSALAEQAPTIMQAGATIINEFLKGIQKVIPEVVKTITTLISEVLKGIRKLIPEFVKTGVELIKNLLKGGKQVLKDVISFGVDVIKNLLKGIRKVFPDIVKTAVEIVKNILSGIRELFPDIVDTGVEIVKSILSGIRELFPDIIDTAWELIMKFASSIRDNIGELVTVGLETVSNFLTGIAEGLPDLIDAAINVAISFINGLADGIENNKEKFVDAVFNLIDSVIDLIIEIITKGIPRMIKKGAEILKGIIKGIKQVLPKLPGIAWDIIKKLGKGIVSLGGKILDIGKDIIGGIINGIKDGFTGLWDAGKELGGKVIDGVKGIFDIHSPSKVMYTLGEYVVQGFKNGIKHESADISDYAEMMTSSFNKVMKAYTKNMDYGKGVVQEFYKNFVKGTADLVAGNKALVNVTNAVKDYAKALYEASDLAKEDMKTSRDRSKEYSKVLKQIEKAKAKVDKLEKKSAETAKKAAETKAKATALEKKANKESEKSEKKKAETKKKAAETSKKADKETSKSATESAKKQNNALDTIKKGLEDLTKTTKKASATAKDGNDELASSADRAAKSIRGLNKAAAETPATTPKILTAKEQFELDKKSGFGEDEDDKKKKKSSKTKSEASKASSAAKKAKSEADKAKKELKDAQKDLKELEKTADKLEKQIDKQGEVVDKHIKQVFNELRNSLAEGVKSFLSPLDISLDTGIDIFSEFNKEFELTSEQVLANMKSQNEGVREWANNLTKLAARGLDEGLVQKLREAGPQSAEQVAAFISMTDAQLKEANEQWKLSNELTAQTVLENQKNALKTVENWADGISELARKGVNKDLLEDLGEAGAGSAEYVKAFLAMTPEQINELNEYYEKYLKIPDKIADQIIASYAVAGDESLKAYVDGASGLGEEHKAELKITKSRLTIARDSNGKVVDASYKGGQAFSAAFATGVEDGKDTVVNATSELAKAVNDNISNSAAIMNAKQTLEEFGKGLYEGITSYLEPLSISLGNAGDLFSEFASSFELTGEQLLANMKSQNEGMAKWAMDLKILAEKGLDEGLIQKLKDAGPQSAEQIAAFMQMTTEQLQEANAQWILSNQLTAQTIIQNQQDALKAAEEWANGIAKLAEIGLNQELLRKLGEAGIGSAEYVKAYLAMSPQQIDELNSYYEKYLTVPATIADTVVKSYASIGDEAMKAYISGATGFGEYSTAEAVGAVKTAYTQVIDEANEAVVAESYKGGAESTQAMANGIVSGQENVKNAADSVGNAVTSSFNNNLKEETAKGIGSTFGEGISAGIAASQPKVSEEAKNVAKTTAEVATAGVKEGMTTAGENAVMSYTDSVTSIGDTNSPEKKDIQTTYVDLTTETGQKTAKEAKFQGEETVKALADGALAREQVVRSAFVQIGRAAFEALQGFLNEDIGQALGANVINGIIIGIRNNESYITEEARRVALVALEAAKAALGVASPSKEFMKVGEFADEGLAIGLRDNAGLVEDEGSSIANVLLNTIKQATKTINAAINDEVAMDPIIKPVIDLSNVTKASKTIDATMTKNLSMKLSAETDINSKKSKLSYDDVTIKPSSGNVGNTYSFVQNNYSPKELSRIDIYRDTKSLFAQSRREVAGA